LPESDLLVSPQHRVLIRSKVAKRMFGEHEVLAAAKQLLDIEGVEVAEDVTEVTYWHFLCSRHEVVFSNGAMTESLYTGAQALKSFPPEVIEEIVSIFPELETWGEDECPDGARILLKGREARSLAGRIAKNSKPLLEAA
jgi:hypothetical protein